MRPTLFHASAFLAGAMLTDAPTAAHAQVGPSLQQSPVPGPVGNPAVPGGPSPGEPGFSTQLFGGSRTSLLGDAFGLRPALGRSGLSLGLQEISEVFGNVTGGAKRGAEYNGVTVMSLGLDTQKAFGWEGGTANISALQIHGRNVSAANLLTLQTASGIEAERATRLWELWYQQAFLGGRVDVKLGQQSVDTEFMGSTGAGTFLNTVMGWPVLPSYDLYAGGPAFPLSSLGARLRAQPSGAWTLLAGAFDDNPPGGPFEDDSQVRGAERSGTTFHLGTGALFIAEVQYALNQPSDGDAAAAGGGGLPGTYKLGAWYDTASFPDARTDTGGLSLADPASGGAALQRRGNYSVYAVADQTVWQPDPYGPRAVSVFARAMGTTGDRNLVDFGLVAGLVLKAPLPGRDDDSVGFGYGYAHVGASRSALERDAAAFSGNAAPVQTSESFVEITYQVQLAPWWQVQPDFQYVLLPGGGVSDPARPSHRVGNEAVFGLRTTVVF